MAALGFSRQFSSPSGNRAEEAIRLCRGIPNGTTQEVKETTRLFINLPKAIFPDKEHNLQFKTVRGNATAGSVSNGGPYGEAFESSAQCWSYYYDFEGQGEIDLNVKNAQGKPDYFVRFIVTPV